MSSSTSFTGIGLSLQSVTPRTGAPIVRVRFTQDPKLVSAAGANDGLNVNNYSIVGPSPAIIIAATITDDPQAVDLTLQAPLPTGNWVLTVANIQTATGDTLQAPTSLSFATVFTGTLEPASMGAINDSAETTLRKHLNPALAGKFWSGLIAALATGDRTNWDNAKSVFDQMFTVSASGIYLDRKAADSGIIKPPAVGMGDSLFRRYAIKTTASKLTTQVLYEILEVFYGSDAVRAVSFSAGEEPFNIADGDDFTVVLDGKDLVHVVFTDEDFLQGSQAKAVEVAAAITRKFRNQRLKAFAVAFQDAETGGQRIAIYSASLGLGAGVQITGGKAQNALRFPELLLTNGINAGVVIGNSWAVTEPQADRMRLTLSGATTFDLSKVQVGDYVNIYGSPFNTLNRGSFPILHVDVRYVAGVLTQFFEVENAAVVAQSPVVMVATTDMLFFRPSRADINGTRAVVVSQPEPGKLHVVLPATTLAVSRTAKTGAYIQQRPALSASSVTELGSGVVTLNFGAAHGLVTGEWIIIDDLQPNPTPTANVAGNGTSTTDANPVSIWSPVGTASAALYNQAACTDANGTKAVIVGGKNTTGPAVSAAVNTLAIAPGSIQANGGRQYSYTWTTATSIPVARENAKLSLLTDSFNAGSMLAVGGNDTAGASLASCYIYDVSGNSWSGAVALGTARSEHEQVVLNDGRVFVAGGRSTTVGLASTELFTSSGAGTGAFTGGASMLFTRANHALVKLADGRILAIGGRRLTSLVDTVTWATAEIYDPATNTWSQTGSMSSARAYHRAVLLPNGQVLAIGGLGYPLNFPDATPAWLSSAEVFDPARGRWYPAGSMGVARQFFEAQYQTTRRKVAVFGGGIRTEYFDVDTWKWSRAPITDSSVESRTRGVSTRLTAHEQIVYVGGLISAAGVNTARIFNPDSEVFAVGGLNGVLYKIASVPSSTSLTIQSPRPGALTAGVTSVQPATAIEATTIPGPYVWDPDLGAGITAVATTTTQLLDAEKQYRTLKVTSASSFPDEEGYLSIAFGTKLQVQPVRYLGRVSATELILDYSFKFPVLIPSGATVTLLVDKGSFLPEHPEDVGSFYLTASSAGRVAAEAAIDNVVGAGIEVEKTIQYPGDRGLGGEGYPAEEQDKLSDKVAVWGGNDIDAEVQAARDGEE